MLVDGPASEVSEAAVGHEGFAIKRSKMQAPVDVDCASFVFGRWL